MVLAFTGFAFVDFAFTGLAFPALVLVDFAFAGLGFVDLTFVVFDNAFTALAFLAMFASSLSDVFFPPVDRGLVCPNLLLVKSDNKVRRK